MASSDPHTVRAFDDDLEEIRALVAELGGLVEAAISSALQALVEADEQTASRVIGDGLKIHRLAEEIERHCIRMIALRAPMADDLRTILAAFKISVLLERMGDCARNIAEQVTNVAGFSRQRQTRILQAMLGAVAEMVRTALEAFIRQDPGSCRQVCASDERVDDLHDELFRDLIDQMAAHPNTIGPCTSLLLASLKLERIGDHAASIARVVHHSATGEPLRDRLPGAAEGGAAQ